MWASAITSTSATILAFAAACGILQKCCSWGPQFSRFQETFTKSPLLQDCLRLIWASACRDSMLKGYLGTEGQSLSLPALCHDFQTRCKDVGKLTSAFADLRLEEDVALGSSGWGGVTAHQDLQKLQQLAGATKTFPILISCAQPGTARTPSSWGSTLGCRAHRGARS